MAEPRPAEPRPPSPDRGAARARILRATLDVVGEEGVRGVSSRRVCEVAGVSLGTLTYHFADQTELLRETLLTFAAEQVERLRSIADRLGSAQLDLQAAAGELERLIDETLDRHDVAAQHELFLYAARTPELRDAGRRCFAAYEDAARAALEAVGVPRPDDLAPVLVALVQGVEVRRLATHEPGVALAEAVRALVRGA